MWTCRSARITPLGMTRLPFGPISRQPGEPSMSPESRTGISIPRLIASVNDSSTWLNLRQGPRMRMPGMIRCLGPTTATVSLAAKSVDW